MLLRMAEVAKLLEEYWLQVAQAFAEAFPKHGWESGRFRFKVALSYTQLSWAPNLILNCRGNARLDNIVVLRRKSVSDSHTLAVCPTDHDVHDRGVAMTCVSTILGMDHPLQYTNPERERLFQIHISKQRSLQSHRVHERKSRRRAAR